MHMPQYIKIMYYHYQHQQEKTQYLNDGIQMKHIQIECIHEIVCQVNYMQNGAV